MTDATPIRTCRLCGCTDLDCSKCVARTGARCSWVEPNLCSACEGFASQHEIVQDITARLAASFGFPATMVVILTESGHLTVGAVAVEHPLTAKFVELARQVEQLVDADGLGVGKRAPVERAVCIHCRKDVAEVTDLDTIREHSMTCAESPVVKANDELRSQLVLAQSAIKYALDRVQTDPDFAYYMLHTATHEKLVAAEASILGKDPAKHIKERREDRQPEYRRREPDIVRLRDKLEELERQVARG